MCSLPNGYDTTDTSLNISITSSQRLELCYSFCKVFGFGAMTFACFAKDDIGAARDESPRLSCYTYSNISLSNRASNSAVIESTKSFSNGRVSFKGIP